MAGKVGMGVMVLAGEQVVGVVMAVIVGMAELYITATPYQA